jgi:hypothetical protein
MDYPMPDAVVDTPDQWAAEIIITDGSAHVTTCRWTFGIIKRINTAPATTNVNFPILEKTIVEAGAAKDGANAAAALANEKAGLADTAAGLANAAADGANTAKTQTEQVTQQALAVVDPVNGAMVRAETAAGEAEDSAELALNNILNGVSAHNLSYAAHQDIRTLLEIVRSIALGASVGYTFPDYATLVDLLNAASKTAYGYGRYLNVLTREIPDLWVSSIEDTSVWYDYTTDDALVADLDANTQVQIGYYKVAMSETKKVVLTNYPTRDEMMAQVPIDKTRTEYDALYAAGQILAGRYYAIDEAH